VKFLRWIIGGVLAGIIKIATGLLFHDVIFGAAYVENIYRAYPAQTTHMALLSIGAGLLFALMYWIFGRCVPGAGAARGFMFGLVIWVGVAFAATVAVAIRVNIPPAAAWAWLLESLVWFAGGGALVGLAFGKTVAR
jgi:hypothetical protein